MGGLATALALAKRGFTNVHVYESASNLGFVGAGIQMAPNMARILDHFGVWDSIEKEATDIKETSIRRKSKFLGSVHYYYFLENGSNVTIYIFLVSYVLRALK
jgi:salicylate hydroxylase